MDTQQLQEKYLPFLKQYFFPIGLGFIGLICLGYGLIILTNKPSGQSDILADGSQTKASVVLPTDTPVREAGITVDIEGAVIKPGVYNLPANSRMQDALIAAGGLAGSANRQNVAKNLNMASKLIDGGKIYIPFMGEDGAISDGTTVLGAQTGILNINTATASDMDNLPGIGSVTAGKIINNRPYSSTDTLVQKKIIGEKEFEKIKGQITAE